MIQRIQSMWLFLAAIFGAFTYKLPFYSGIKKVKEISQPVKLDASSDFIIMILTGAIIALSFVTIFLYKGQKDPVGDGNHQHHSFVCIDRTLFPADTKF